MKKKVPFKAEDLEPEADSGKLVQLLRTEFPPTDVINYRHHTTAVVKFIYRTP